MPTCKTCEGQKLIEITCSRCNGNGQIIGSSSTGELGRVASKERCPECDMRGKKMVECAPCEGTGEELAESEINLCFLGNEDGVSTLITRQTEQGVREMYAHEDPKTTVIAFLKMPVKWRGTDAAIAYEGMAMVSSEQEDSLGRLFAEQYELVFNAGVAYGAKHK